MKRNKNSDANTGITKYQTSSKQNSRNATNSDSDNEDDYLYLQFRSLPNYYQRNLRQQAVSSKKIVKSEELIDLKNNEQMAMRLYDLERRVYQLDQENSSLQNSLNTLQELLVSSREREYELQSQLENSQKLVTQIENELQQRESQVSLMTERNEQIKSELEQMNLIGENFNRVIDSNQIYAEVIEETANEANFWKRKYQEKDLEV